MLIQSCASSVAGPNSSGPGQRAERPTIQRIEAGQPASVETLKSIASVFEVDFSTLNAEETNMDTTMTAADEAEREAFAHVRELRGFYGLACATY